MNVFADARRDRIILFALLGSVATVALCIGWNMWLVRERRAMRQWIEDRGGFVSLYDSAAYQAGDTSKVFQEKIARFPRMRLLFGDEAVYYVNLVYASVTWADRQRVARLFPEAFVVPERATGFAKKRSSKGHITDIDGADQRG